MKKFVMVGNAFINVDEIQCLTMHDTYGKLYVKDMDVITLDLDNTKQLTKQLAEMEWIDGNKEH
jgi:hypothetical protein